LAIVPMTFDNVRSVKMELGILEWSGMADDTLVINEGSLEAAGWQNFDVYTGIGNDALSVNNADLRLPVAGGAFWYHPEGGYDTLKVAGDTNLNVNSLRVASDAGGQVSFDNLETVELVGGAGNNTLNAVGFTGRATLRGLGGNDVLRGSANDDLLYGGDGDDELYGGLGNDVLNGGANVDKIYFDGTTNDDDLRVQYNSSTSATYLRKLRGATSYLELDALTYDSSDLVFITAYGGSDLITVDAAITTGGTVNGGAGIDTCTAPSSWTRISCE
jgi:Ca2+-binding RTX toxin-like protein